MDEVVEGPKDFAVNDDHVRIHKKNGVHSIKFSGRIQDLMAMHMKNVVVVIDLDDDYFMERFENSEDWMPW
ncbi:conserved hypothetical protein [Ricinus communis]|uniref:Uncharacterized protein n=1 Tax=Ricinus communis TaxID=3988 RepID=B9SDR4_RICCO|nr:conserved hypothetical protein [Ricinus communis]